MTIRVKTTLVLACTFVGMLGLLAILMANILASSFQSLENRSMQRNAELARDSLRLMHETFGTRVLDWSTRDDTWKFMQSRDIGAFEKHFTDETLLQRGINGAAFFSTSGELVYSRFIDLDSEPRFAPRDLEEHFARGTLLSTHRDALEMKSGILALRDGLYLIGAAPIVTSEGTGPVRGTAVFVRRFDDVITARLAAVTHQDITVLTKATSQPSAEPTSLFQLKGTHASLEPLDSHRISASLPISDVYGTEIGSIEIKHPRLVLAEGRETMRLFILCMVAIALSILFASSRLINQLILKPLSKMQTELERIAASGDLSVQLPVTGRDELSELSLHFNRMTSALQYARAQLEEVARAAEAGNQAKSSFLANMSHEIRTPMTAILGYIDVLLSTDLPHDQQIDHMRTIQRNGRHLLQVINDVLDISKIEAGRLDVEQIECSPVQIIADVTSMMRVRATEKQLDFEVAFDGSIPRTIQSDPTRLRQILLNLVGNAIKFTETGGVTLRVRCDVDEATDNATLLIHVIDSGIGLDEKQMDRLFQPFTQADHTTTRKFGGTGLGLVISRRLARILGGDVVAESKLGEGSSFTLRLDLGPIDTDDMLDDPSEALLDCEHQSDEPNVPLEQGDRSSARILLAEDGPDNQRLISFILTKAGHDVTIAENGEVAFDLACTGEREGKPYDIILMDMQMPVLDGYSATRELRQHGFKRPIIALTAHAMTEDRQKCLDAGCDDFATKPIDRAGLIDLIERYMRESAHTLRNETVRT